MPQHSYILLATRNKGKISEFAGLFRQSGLDDLGLEILGLDLFPNLEDVDETGSTFLENARLKAEYACQNTGLISVADDSGLAVDALAGAPGVRSARFSAAPGFIPNDQSNIAKLLELLKDTPQDQRRCSFHCAMVAVAPNGASIQAEGIWPGTLTTKPAGDMGFGYDPIFLDPELNLTAAQMAPDLKNSRSHRARALNTLLAQWPGFWEKFRRG